jgi:hypothetical protein
MSQVKVGVSSPDPVLQRSAYAESALARIAHVNEAIRLLKADCSAVSKLPTYVPLAATTITALKPELDAKLLAIETKLNALIAALS